MQDKNVLLTYKNRDGIPTFEWFYDIEELMERIDEGFAGTDVDCIELEHYRDITDMIEEKVIKLMNR